LATCAALFVKSAVRRISRVLRAASVSSGDSTVTVDATVCRTVATKTRDKAATRRADRTPTPLKVGDAAAVIQSVLQSKCQLTQRLDSSPQSFRRLKINIRPESANATVFRFSGRRYWPGGWLYNWDGIPVNRQSLLGWTQSTFVEL